MKGLHLKDWLAIPGSLDPDDARRRRLLNVLASGVLVASILVLVVGSLAISVGVETIQTMSRGFVAGTLMLFCSLVVLKLNQRMTSGWVPALIFLVVGTIAVSITDEPEEIAAGRSMVVLIVPIIMAGVLMPPWSSFVMAGVCSVILIVLSHIVTIVPNMFAMIIFLVIAIVSWLSGSTVQHALRDLRQLNLELDQRVQERTRDLAEALSRNEAILEGIADGVIVFDTTGRVTSVNEAMAKLLGRPVEEIVGCDVDTLMGQEVGTDDREIIGNLLVEKDKSYPGFRFTWGNKVFSTSFASVRDNLGRRTGTVAVFRDFTKEAELERLKSTFVSQVSHELRTPLNAIIGYADMLQEHVYGPINAEQAQAIERIMVNSKRQLSIVNDLLDQAQIEAGTLKLKIGLFSPQELIRDTLNVMDVLAQSKGLTLSSQIAADTPAKLPGDRQRLQQILINLTGNAVKFTDQGSVNIRIYKPNPTHWAIEVSDTGCGIPPEAREYIFDPFRQVDSSVTRKHSGSGLGLSIVKQLVNLMGGEITLESEVGKGSTFTVTLPLVPVQEGKNAR